MSADIIAYFPEIKNFAEKAKKDAQKVDIIKLYYLMIKQVRCLSIIIFKIFQI